MIRHDLDDLNGIMRRSCLFGSLSSGDWSRDGSPEPEKAAALPWMKSHGRKIATPRCLKSLFTRIFDGTSPPAHGSSMMLIQGKIRDDL